MKNLVLFSLLLSLATGAHACKCTRLSLQEKFERSELVLVGSYVPGQEITEKQGATLRFKVSRVLKVSAAPETEIQVYPMLDTSCAAAVLEGVELLVFTQQLEESPSPAISVCSARAVRPFSLEGKEYQPGQDVVEFLRPFER